MLYHLCTGEMAFKGRDTLAIILALALETPQAPHEIDPAVPVELSDLVMHLLAKNPDKRLASAQAVIETLDGAPIYSRLSGGGPAPTTQIISEASRWAGATARAFVRARTPAIATRPGAARSVGRRFRRRVPRGRGRVCAFANGLGDMQPLPHPRRG